MLIKILNNYIGKEKGGIMYGSEKEIGSGSKILDICREHELLVTKPKFWHWNYYCYNLEGPRRNQKSLTDLI